MKVFLKQRYSDEAFESVLVRPTTKFERNALKLLKGDLLVGEYGEFHPELLGEDLCVKYAKALDYNIPEHYSFDINGVLYWWEEEEGELEGCYQYFNNIPSNIEVLEAAYKMAGKYRKLARFKKEVNRIEKIRMARYERMYNELSKQHRVAWEAEQEAV